MAINVNVKAGGVEPIVKPGQGLDMAALMGESSTPEVVEQAQPTQQPRSADMATEQDLQNPALRSASPRQAEVSQQLQETQFSNPETVAAVEAEAAEQRRQPLTEVMDGLAAEQKEKNAPFGAAIDRADRFSILFQDKLESGATVQGAYLGQAQTQELLSGATPESMGHSNLSLKNILLNQDGLDAGMITPEGLTVVDPHFSRVAGFTTEQWMSGATAAEADAQSGFELDQEAAEEGESVSRGMGNAALGREIFKQWKRDQNYVMGNPTDDYDMNAMDNDQYEVLGTMAKEMYAAANPDMIKRAPNADGSKVEFQLTPIGAVNIRNARAAMPDAFINNEIPPSSAPKAALKKIGEGEARRNLKGKTTAVVNRKIRQIEEAKTNMNSISHVVDPLRRKIFFQIAIDVLKALKSGQAIPKHADLFDIGPEKFKYFKGEAQLKNQNLPQDQQIDPKREYQNYVNKFLETMNTAARYSGKNNHLDFAVQELQSRMHVEQTRFNPQGNPWLRFITGGAKPASFKKGGGSEAELMFKELMAVHFLDAGNLLPDQRIKAFNQDWNNPNGRLKQLAKQGKQTEATLLSPQEDASTTTAIGQIKLTPQGINVPPQLQNTKKLEVNETLLSHAANEGIEGLSLIEAAIELGRYATSPHDAQFTTNIGVEFDGKTHGPATNMMQLGIDRGAYRVGVLRREGATKKLDSFTVGDLLEQQGISAAQQAALPETEIAEGDIRIGMKNYMLEVGQQDFANFLNEEVAVPMYRILQEAVKDKANFLKKSPMTLGYGQLMKNLVGHIQTTVYSGPRSGQIKEIINDNRTLLESMARPVFDRETGDKRQQTAEEVAIEALHSILADSINIEMDPEVGHIGQLLRANNVVSLMTNDIIAIDNALGFKTYIGAKQSTMKEEKARLPVTPDPSTGLKSVGDVPLYSSAPAGSAERDGKPGGWGRGRIIPAVIQGLDGAWMNRMFTSQGGSWDALKGNYMLPIMDAVKTDLTGARKIREHANNNWWKGIREWSYVDQVMGEWGPNTIKGFRDRIKAMDPDTVIDVGPDTNYRGVGWLFALDADGKPAHLIDTVYDTMPKPVKPTSMTVAQFEEAQKAQAKTLVEKYFPEKIFRSIEEKGSVTPEQMLFLFDRMLMALDLESRNKSAVSKTRSRREALFSKVRSSGNETLQIDLG